MFVSIVFPLADFRGLHGRHLGRLDKPAWGATDPRARFARGFGEIHTRTKPGNFFPGESYYADCNSLIKYPKLLFVEPLTDIKRPTLAYPIHRRFYADGKFSGRIELGFRLNEPSVWEIGLNYPSAKYDPASIVKQMMSCDIEIELLDGRQLKSTLYKSAEIIRDGFIMSSTFNRDISSYGIDEISKYVSVGSPFAFVRAAKETPIQIPEQRRFLVRDSGISFFMARSGLQRQIFDIAAIESKAGLNLEDEQERMLRIFYCQIRTIAFAHSFYLRQINDQKISGASELAEALRFLIERLGMLVPKNENDYIGGALKSAGELVKNMDVNVAAMEAEIRQCVKLGPLRRLLGNFFGYFDKKADVAIEAAASAATKQILGGGL